jgi:transcriptional regulator with XRE-family HTH domain
VDLVRLGLAVRALRRRRAWRQADLAAAAGVSQGLISLIERGHGDSVSVRVLIKVAGKLDSRLIVQLRWRAGELDRLLDADHAQVSTAMIELLRADGWEVRVEVSHGTARSSGSIDLLAWHPQARALLVIEIKTEIPSAEATLRKLDEKARLAASVARERFGWVAASVSHVLVLEDTSTNRRRLRGAQALVDAALPERGAALKRWLAQPSGSAAGHLFLSASNGSAGIHRRGGRHRIRRVVSGGRAAGPTVDSRATDQADEESWPHGPSWLDTTTGITRCNFPGGGVLGPLWGGLSASDLRGPCFRSFWATRGCGSFA